MAPNVSAPGAPSSGTFPLTDNGPLMRKPSLSPIVIVGTHYKRCKPERRSLRETLNACRPSPYFPYFA